MLRFISAILVFSFLALGATSAQAQVGPIIRKGIQWFAKEGAEEGAEKGLRKLATTEARNATKETFEQGCKRAAQRSTRELAKDSSETAATGTIRKGAKEATEELSERTARNETLKLIGVTAVGAGTGGYLLGHSHGAPGGSGQGNQNSGVAPTGGEKVISDLFKSIGIPDSFAAALASLLAKVLLPLTLVVVAPFLILKLLMIVGKWGYRLAFPPRAVAST